MQLPKRGLLIRSTGEIVWTFNRPHIPEGENVGVDEIAPRTLNLTTGEITSDSEPGDLVVDLTALLSDVEMAEVQAEFSRIKCVEVATIWEFQDKATGEKHRLNTLLENARKRAPKRP